MGFFDLLWGWADYSPKNWSGPLLSVEEEPTCFIVRDQTGQKLAHVYFEDDPGRRSAAKLLSRDQALRVAGQLCKAPGVVAYDMFGF